LNPNSAVYYANRSFANLRAELYGSAIIDATKAIEIDKKYIKGYYRRGSALLAIRKFKEGLADFRQVVKIVPHDRDAQVKLTECDKAVKLLLFQEAIAADYTEKSILEDLDFESMIVDPSYKGVHLTVPLQVNDVLQMVEDFKNQKKIDKKYAYTILSETRQLLCALPNILEIIVPQGTNITICGDVHGQFYDVLNIFKINGWPSESNSYLFNGDFVDRGSFSVEVMLTFFAFKLLYPNHFHLTRGNHEAKTMNKLYGFEGEVKAKYSENMFAAFSEVFNWLPLAAVIGEKVFILHGGLFSKDGVTLDEIKKIERNREPPEEGIMSDMLWSDPQKQLGRGPSKRGPVGVAFGPDVTHKFLRENKLNLLIRSHEVKDEGYEIEADGKLITIFSAPNYCDQMGNRGAFIKLGSDLKPNFTQFTAVPHPDIKPMAYAGSASNLIGM